MILDTCFLIDIHHGDNAAIQRARKLENSAHKQRISAMTMAELQDGVARSGRPQDEFDKMMDVTATKEIVPMSREIAMRAGRIHGELMTAGDQIDMQDCIIAATALQFQEPVVTRNVDHFERVDGLLIREC